MVAEAKVELTLEGKVDILREHGVEVIQWLEPETSRYFPLPTVFFEGDENEGHRALKVMQQHGIYVYGLQRHWQYEGREELLDEYWGATPLGPPSLI